MFRDRSEHCEGPIRLEIGVAVTHVFLCITRAETYRFPAH
jgi:hypothetical protein